jgi:hypothetical protein
MVKKKAAVDKAFVKNLGDAMKEEARKKSRKGLPAFPLAARDGSVSGGAEAKAGAVARRKDSPKRTAVAKEKKEAKSRGSAKAARAAGETQAKATDEAKAQLLKELKAILGKLDAEGLAFLLEQARVHLYNMEADRLDALKDSMAGSAPAAGKAAALRVERSQSGSSYYVVQNGAYIMFSPPEMAMMARLAHGNADDYDAAQALAKWLEKERSDALSELWRPVQSGHPLAPLVAVLRKTFKKPGA